MAPAKNSKPSDYNPWGWVSQVKPEDVNETHVMHAYRILGFQPCAEARLVNLQIPCFLLKRDIIVISSLA